MTSHSVVRSTQLSLLGTLPIVVICGLSGLVIAHSPQIGVALLALAAFFVVTTVAGGVTTRVAGPLCIALLIPADHILPFAENRTGFFYLGLGVLLLGVALTRVRLQSAIKLDWTYLVYAASVILFCAIHLDKGAVRGAIFWAAGGAVSVWLAIERSESDSRALGGIESALCIAGAVSGGVGVLEHLGVFDPTTLIPFYEGTIDSFSYLLGVRAVGLSGHPLCLGTMTMLATVILLSRLVSDYPSRRPTLGALTFLGCSFTGLIVSGARGSWIAALFGLFAAVTTAIVRSRAIPLHRLIRLALLIGGLLAILVVSGFGQLVFERTMGSAVAPASIDQRVAATHSVLEAVPDIPLIGVGPGAMNQYMLRWGLVVPNLESEYLIALVGFGPIGLALLVACAIVLWTRALGIGRHSGNLVPLAAITAFLVNLATFNLLSWSAGAVLLAVLSFLCVLPQRGSSHLEGTQSPSAPDATYAEASR